MVNTFSVHESFYFANKVSSICPDNFMASLDAESLFINIPLNDVIDICVNNLFSYTDTIRNLDKNDLKELLILASFESFFIFDEVLYRQIDGVAMGSPLGPILANVFLCYFEKKCLSDCPPYLSSKDLKRFVDDIFAMFLCKTQLNEFVFYMNTKHSNRKFTLEFEEDDSLCF